MKFGCDGERIGRARETHSLRPLASTVVPLCELPAPAVQSEREPFERVYAEHFSFVWRCLRSLGVGTSILDDAAQDVFVVVHRQLPTFKGESTLRSWLFGIVRNVASNHRRSAQRKGQTEPIRDDPVDPRPSPLHHVQDRQAAEFVQRFLDGLDIKKREVFVLAVLEEMSVVETAAALGIPLNTAYTRLRRVRADFRQALSEQKGER